MSKEKKYSCCQSCGIPFNKDPQQGGTQADGSKSGMYCSYCYQNGAFVNTDLTAAEMQAYAAKNYSNTVFRLCLPTSSPKAFLTWNGGNNPPEPLKKFLPYAYAIIFRLILKLFICRCRLPLKSLLSRLLRVPGKMSIARYLLQQILYFQFSVNKSLNTLQHLLLNSCLKILK